MNPSNSAVVAFVEVGVPGFAQSVSRRVDVPAGQSVAVEGLTPTFDFDALYGVVTPVVAEVEVSNAGRRSGRLAFRVCDG